MARYGKVRRMNQKTCGLCKKRKPRSAFGLRRKAKDGKQSRCKACRNAERMRYHHAHPEVQAYHAKQYRIVLRKMIFERLKSGCADCPEVDPVTLDFDHRDPKTKTNDISRLLRRGCSRSVLEAELAKCDVVCANCHRKRTAKRSGNWRMKFQ